MRQSTRSRGALGGRSVNEGLEAATPAALATAVLVDLLLIALFAAQHSVMARPAFKRRFTRIIFEPIERSTYVLASSAALAILMLLWRPLPGVLWQVEAPLLVGALWGLFAYGWLLMLWATFMIDHFDLFGLRQVWLYWRGREYAPVPFQVGGAYRYMRHPMMLGLIIAFWAGPRMTACRFVLALGLTLYTFLGILLEERTLRTTLGLPYQRYLEKVPRFVPRFVRRIRLPRRS